MRRRFNRSNFFWAFGIISFRPQVENCDTSLSGMMAHSVSPYVIFKKNLSSAIFSRSSSHASLTLGSSAIWLFGLQWCRVFIFSLHIDCEVHVSCFIWWFNGRPTHFVYCLGIWAAEAGGYDGRKVRGLISFSRLNCDNPCGAPNFCYSLLFLSKILMYFSS